jgi:AcrR family transcriptional regulator
MVETPWGDSEELRARKLTPGRGNPPQEVERNQRERLFAAMVASSAEKGYQETTVADLLRISGVSRSTFYLLFKDKQACFRAAIERLLSDALLLVRNRYELDIAWEEKAKASLESFIWLASVQPAAARMCLVESYAAGEAGLEPLRQASDELMELAGMAFDRMPGREGMPPELAGAIGGGFHRVLYRRLHTHREAELPGLAPQLWEWAMEYPTPPQPLRVRQRQTAGEGGPPAFDSGPRELRIVRAFAAIVGEKGYAATKIADIAAAASISQSTFYAHFDDKREALTAALDYSGAQLTAITLPALRRAPDWPDAVRIAYDSMCGFLAAEPAFARLRTVAIYGVGPDAIEQRDAAATEILGAILPPPAEGGPEISPLVAEAVIGAVYTAIHNHVRQHGTETLPKLAPLLTYVTLAPLLGAERACAVANGDGRGAR